MIAEAFARIVELAEVLGVQRINELPGGRWTHAFGDGWSLRVNANAETVDNVPPYHALVARHGLPALLISPRGGTTLGHGAEDDFIAAVQAEIARAGTHRRAR